MRPTITQFVLVGIALLAVAATVLSLSQPKMDSGRFEFDIRQNFEGVYRAQPVPALWVLRGQDPGHLANYSVYPLVGAGFHGLTEFSNRFDGRGVSLSGKLIYNGTFTAIETDEASIDQLTSTVEFPDPAPPRELGDVVLRGEILDLKSYAGYQEPGFGSWLIAPSSNAIRGGIPPVLVLRDKNGDERVALLLNSDGESVGDAVLGRVGTPVEVRGKLRGVGGLLTLEVSPGSIRRLFPWE